MGPARIGDGRKGGVMATKGKAEYSAGARYERKAVREYLARLLKAENAQFVPSQRITELLRRALRWVRTRQTRYDNRPGGL